jgi:serine/threonine-protein kinase HipA
MSPELQKVNALGVYLHDRRIGIINRLAGDRHIYAFEQEYLDDPNRPTLSLSYKGRTGGLVTTVRPVSRRLPPFFSNLLPEGHLRDYLAAKAGVKKAREFYLMAVLGADLAGAVIVRPMDAGDHDDQHEHPEHHDEEDEKQKNVLRFSLAGVQLKFSAVMEASGGLTVPAHGVGGSWIVKLPSTQHAAVSENEYAMLELARATGIQCPPVRLVPVGDIEGLPPDAARLKGKALAVERFDRAAGGRRIHMEDFAQVFGLFPDDKYGERSYANIAAVLWAETGEGSTYEFVRRLVFSVLIGNADMHLKNWSLLYPDGRMPVLSPAYDFVSTLPYIPGDTLALSFGGTKSLDGVTLDQVRRFADTARLPMKPLNDIVAETVEKTQKAWGDLPHKDLLPREILKVINDQIANTVRSVRKSSWTNGSGLLTAVSPVVRAVGRDYCGRVRSVGRSSEPACCGSTCPHAAGTQGCALE